MAKMSQEIVQVNSFLRGYHEQAEWEPRLGDFCTLMPNLTVERIQKNVLTTQQWKGYSQRETSKESWYRIGLEVPCEYEFESDSFLLAATETGKREIRRVL